MSAVVKKTQANQAASVPTPAVKSKKTMAIGVVLQRLSVEFPDVTVSKIRFLESEGLITPQRTASGYRRFTQEDVDRLRFILTTQRDNYLPLKVIREQLEAMDAGVVSSIGSAGLGAAADQIVSPENFKRNSAPSRLSEQDLATAADVPVNKVRTLAKGGVIKADSAGYFASDDVQIVTLAVQLEQFGFDVRHLKNLRNTAARQADLVAKAVKPMAHAKGDNATLEARELSRQMSALMVSLHTNFLTSALQDELGS